MWPRPPPWACWRASICRSGRRCCWSPRRALLFQPAQRRLERLADRWVFGARLDGYEVLTRFGSMLETSPGPADLLPRLAAAVRDGLGLQWARVRLDLVSADSSLPAAGAAGIEPGDRPSRRLPSR